MTNSKNVSSRGDDGEAVLSCLPPEKPLAKTFRRQHAGMAESAYATVPNTVAARHPGSTPGPGTTP